MVYHTQGAVLAASSFGISGPGSVVLLMDKILHDPKDPKLWELWYIFLITMGIMVYIPYNG